jgi:ATP-binding cassette subfamily B protein
MFILPYLRPYYGTLALVLVLATCNQVFSLLDPQVFGWLMDNYITKIDTLKNTPDILIHGVLLGMG